MNVKNIMILVLVVLGLIASLGCIETGSNSGPTPEVTLNNYVKYYNNIESDKIYELFNANMKQEYSKDKLYNLLSANRLNFEIDDYEIRDEIKSENSVLMSVDVTWNIRGMVRETRSHLIEFVLEDDVWKISSEPFLNPSSKQ